MLGLSSANCKSYFQSCNISKLLNEVKSQETHEVQCYDCEAGRASWLTATVEVPKENAVLWWYFGTVMVCEVWMHYEESLEVYIWILATRFGRAGGREGNSQCLAVKFLGI